MYMHEYVYVYCRRKITRFLLKLAKKKVYKNIAVDVKTTAIRERN